MSIILVLDNLRSSHNVGSILRTADATGISSAVCVGTTPYPAITNDIRPGHIAVKNTRDIAKTALGAEQSISISYEAELKATLKSLRDKGVIILALELSDQAISLFDFHTDSELNYALILGNEVDGINLSELGSNDIILEIPMLGAKESLNVAVSAGIAMYQLTR
jgi:23S rRNA (guanosine2251-2'-O)-methyltransferase